MLRLRSGKYSQCRTFAHRLESFSVWVNFGCRTVSFSASPIPSRGVRSRTPFPMENVAPYLRNGDFAGSAECVISDFVGYYDKAIDMGYTYDADSGVWAAPVKKKSLSPLKLLISALLSALTASGSVNSVKRKYAMKDEAASAAKSTVAALAVAGLGFAFANRQDDLIDSHTVRRALPMAPKGGGVSGGDNKPFGGSTTHTGAGGMTFGGKTGGKF